MSASDTIGPEQAEAIVSTLESRMLARGTPADEVAAYGTRWRSAYASNPATVGPLLADEIKPKARQPFRG